MPEEDFSELEYSGLKKMYETTREWSLDFFNLIYKRIGTKFDRLYFESEVGNKGLQVVKENLGKIFEEDDGAVIYKGDPDKGLHTRFL
jgi:arginyl-tRNA synthetase